MNLTQDLKVALRRMRKGPLFTAIAVATLALGIGSSTALFSLLDQVLLRKLPVRQPEQLVVLSNDGDWQGWIDQVSEFSNVFSFPMFRTLASESRVTSDMLARVPVPLSIAWTAAAGGGSRAEVVGGEMVTGNYFSMLGVQPTLGRLLSVEDDRTRGGSPVAVLSHAAWVARFGADPAVVGRMISINGASMTVIGVAAKGFESVQVGLQPELFVPMQMKPVITPRADNLDDERAAWVDIVARLSPGVSIEQAQAQLQTVFRARLADEASRQTWTERTKQEYIAKPLGLLPGARGRSDFRGRSADGLIALLALVGLVLLVACANLANLLAAKATARRREVALRRALGGSRWDTVRELMVESLLLAALGGAAGLAVAAALLGPGLELLGAEGLARAFTYHLDLRLLLYVVGVSSFAGVLLGLLPALEASRVGLASRLREDAAGSGSSRGALYARRALVALQVALSTVVLIGAGLFTRSLDRLLALDPGFRVERTVTFAIDPMLRGATLQRAVEIDRRVAEELLSTPGVEGVGMSHTAFLTDSSSQSSIEVEGRPRGEDDPSPRYSIVSNGLHAVLDWPIVQGRGFTDADRAGAPRVAVVNESMVKAYFPDGAIGRRFRRTRADSPWLEVVGVARDTHWSDTRDERAEPAYFVSWEQGWGGQGMTYYLETALDQASALAAVRQAVGRVDAELPVTDLQLFPRQVASLTSGERFLMRFSLLFGAVATLLAALGLYGVLSYWVERRRREIGVRAALGATPRDLVRRVLGDGARPVAIGLVLGLILALGAARLGQGLLYGVSAWDPLAYAVAPPLLAAIALFAAWLPAHRAGRVDPARALREE
jgi:predicted permease